LLSFELSIDNARHCAATNNLHSRLAHFAKACRGHFQLQLLKRRNEGFAEVVPPEAFPERQWLQLQAL